MTKENRERAYKHFKDIETNYIPKEGENSGLFSEDVMKKRAKKRTDDMLKKNPELVKLHKPVKKKVIKPEVNPNGTEPKGE